MKPTLIISASELAKFQADLKRLASESKRPAPKYLNQKAYFIGADAMDRTQRASRDQIEALGLKTVAITERVNSKGKTVRRRKLAFDASAAYGNYVAALVHNKGRKGAAQFIRAHFASRADIEARARKWIASKLRAIGFLASLWRPTLAALSSFGGGKRAKSEFSGKHANVQKVLNRATPSKLTVDFGFIAGSDKHGTAISRRQRYYALKAFSESFRAEAADQAQRLGQTIKEHLKRSGFPVT